MPGKRKTCKRKTPGVASSSAGAPAKFPEGNEGENLQPEQKQNKLEVILEDFDKESELS